METEIFGGCPAGIRNTHFTVDDLVAHLVGDHVEVEAVGNESIRIPLTADLDETVAGIGVVEDRQDRELDPRLITSKMPLDRPAKVALPHVEDESDRAEEVCHLELRSAGLEIVEMSFRIRLRRCSDLSVPRRQEQARHLARVVRDAIRLRLPNRVDGVGAAIRGTGADRPWRRGNEDGLRLDQRTRKARLRIELEARALVGRSVQNELPLQRTRSASPILSLRPSIGIQQ